MDGDGSFVVAPDVRRALDEGRAVVALESTVITHGMPHPENAETAKSVEAEVRRHGCLPATITIIDGKVHVGLTEEQIDRLAQSSAVLKAGVRDLPMAVLQKWTAGTTVSATMHIAHVAGIQLLVTGGIGGVHRNANESWDVSSDLIELSRTPVIVVCAGVKSILDIPKTLEFMETHGIPVVTLATDKAFPGFFYPDSGCESPYCLPTEEDMAGLIGLVAQRALGIRAGTLVAVPPTTLSSASMTLIQESIQRALEDIRMANVRGKEVTPYLLRRVNELSAGAALRSNIALLRNNARAGARIASALIRLA